MLNLKNLSIVTCMALACNSVYAQTATQQLQQFVDQVQSAKGQFSQHTTDAQGSKRPTQQGQFVFQRPGKFKWEVQQPYEQLVWSDGQQLYQYDPDLNQLSQRQVDQAIGASPAAILFGSGRLDDSFEVQDLAPQDQLHWLRATPKGEDAGFEYIDMAFAQQLPVRLVLLDAFGQKTHIELKQVDTQATISDQDFSFDPPADVDVVKLP